MATNTTIKKDHLGLYTIAGGYISRPFYGTSFTEGDEVKCHHFGGSTDAGVTLRDKPETHNFKSDGKYEIWCTTGMSSTQYKKASIAVINEKYNWYKQYCGTAKGVYGKRNQLLQIKN